MAWIRTLLTVTGASCSFSKRNGPFMPMDQKPNQTVTSCVILKDREKEISFNIGCYGYYGSGSESC